MRDNILDDVTLFSKSAYSSTIQEWQTKTNLTYLQTFPGFKEIVQTELSNQDLRD